jgi:hypothetical protein
MLSVWFCLIELAVLQPAAAAAAVALTLSAAAAAM